MRLPLNRIRSQLTTFGRRRRSGSIPSTATSSATTTTPSTSSARSPSSTRRATSSPPPSRPWTAARAATASTASARADSEAITKRRTTRSRFQYASRSIAPIRTSYVAIKKFAQISKKLSERQWCFGSSDLMGTDTTYRDGKKGM